MARWAQTLALILAIGATAAFAEDLTSQGRGLQQYYGFPWCSCGNRAPSVSPISIAFDHYHYVRTPGLPVEKYACFYLSVDAGYKSDCKECANMDVGKIEWLVKGDKWNTDCLVTKHHLPIPGSWGQVPHSVGYKANVLKCTNLVISQKDILHHDNQFEICFNMGPWSFLSDFSGFKADQITAAIFEPSTSPVCCPTITTALPPPPPVCSPPPSYDPKPTPKPYDPTPVPSPKPYTPTPTPTPTPKPYDPTPVPSPKSYDPTPVPSPKPHY